VRAWGKKGAAEGEFNLPHGIAVDKRGRVYVGDRENRRIQVFDADGTFLTQWKHVGSPWGVVITDDDHLFLCDGYNNRILKTTLNGEVLGALGGPGKLPGLLDYSHHLAVGPSGSIYVAEIKNWRVQKFAPWKQQHQ
jgi:DNA-binding beta-propeller fold protein YncE